MFKESLRDLLAGPDGMVSPQLQLVVAALESVPTVRKTLTWLRSQKAGRLLVDLAQQEQWITHEVLDQLPPGPAVAHLRSLLVHSGALPERITHLESLGPWLDRQLAQHPDHHARVIRPFAQWHVLRRARRWAARRDFTPGAAAFAKHRIRLALDFLTWLDEHQRTLDAVTQHDIDRWRSEGSTRRHDLRDFIRWAIDRGLLRDVAVPARTVGAVTNLLTDQERIEMLRRCIHEDMLPLDVRVAGAFVLLFGVTVNRVVQLTTDELDHRDDGVHIRLGQKLVHLPPRLADLAQDLVQSRWELRGRSAVGRALDRTSFLFPGRNAGRPINAYGFMSKMNRYGILIPAARNSARRALAEDLPAPVLADLFGMHIETAVRWTHLTQRDRTGYVAARWQDERQYPRE